MAGRPRWAPTAEDIKRIERLASYDLSQEEIAGELGISDRTLLAHKKTNNAISSAIARGKLGRKRKCMRALQKAGDKGNVYALIWELEHVHGYAQQRANEILLDHDTPEGVA